MIKIIAVAISAFFGVNIVITFADIFKKGNVTRKLERQLILNAVVLFAVFMVYSTTTMAKTERDALGRYLFTSDEHYFEFDIVKIDEERESLWSDDCTVTYTTSEGEEVVVNGDSIKVYDIFGTVIYSNSGGKIIVQLESR